MNKVPDDEEQLIHLSAQIPILYEDNHVVVVVKPANMPTQEDESRDPDLLSVLKAGIKMRYGKPGNVYLGLVHRLDRPVGGAMVFARTSKAASRLSESVRSRSFRKVYFAVIHGTPRSPSGMLRHFLLKDAGTNTVRAMPSGTPEAKEAILEYRTLGVKDGLTLLEIHLHTGRSHQIRVQFAEIGCPLFGDQRYGGSQVQRGEQIALWSVLVGFEHPTLRSELSYRSVPPMIKPWHLWSGSIGDLVEQIH